MISKSFCTEQEELFFDGFNEGANNYEAANNGKRKQYGLRLRVVKHGRKQLNTPRYIVLLTFCGIA